RLPGWCKSVAIAVNGRTVASPAVEKGYAVLGREWKASDRITLTLDMPVEVVAADPRVRADAGKRAVQRGPLVYCAEETDNAGRFDRIALSPETSYQPLFRDSMLGGVTTVTVTAANGTETFTLIPYYAWDNREAGEMKVWMDYIEK
ncbi:MAG: glycoside hydrolase family 127 protein, partial [Tannerella sp.]|nr:glycoside hydrolase family 127 protein [Tannerella sp.]